MRSSATWLTSGACHHGLAYKTIRSVGRTKATYFNPQDDADPVALPANAKAGDGSAGIATCIRRASC